jgi:hypothetical protein
MLSKNLHFCAKFLAKSILNVITSVPDRRDSFLIAGVERGPAQHRVVATPGRHHEGGAVVRKDRVQSWRIGGLRLPPTGHASGVQLFLGNSLKF